MKVNEKIKYWCWISIKLARYMNGFRKRKCILIDTPTHGNLGDQAIVLAEKELLEENNISVYELTAQEVNNQEKKYAMFTPRDKIILVHGGGFLGTLWPNEEERFRRILQAFYKQKIIIFPQTITFDLETREGKEYLKKSQEIYSGHPDLTIFVREKKSYEFMKLYFPTVKCKLVPDIVIMLQTDVNEYNRQEILFCMRRDREKKVSESELEWIKQLVQKKFPNALIKYTDTVVKHDITLNERSKEVDKILKQFKKTKLLITDRLHGMIFAIITGTPCIALGNSNGKVKGVYEWIKKNDYVIYVDKISKINQILEKIDLEKKYTFNKEDIITKFSPLLQVIEKIKEH